jgi:F0F1-type ATP synthase delta subunit
MNNNSVIARAVLAEIENGTHTDTVASSLAAYLIEEKKVGDLGAITREIERLLLKDRNKLYVHVTTAHAIDESVMATVRQTFTNTSNAKEVIIEHTINPDVIGGVRCETAEQRLDLTVRRQLQRLKSVRRTGEL